MKVSSAAAGQTGGIVDWPELIHKQRVYVNIYADLTILLRRGVFCRASCFDIPAELLKQARCELKMTKVQTLKCWEALLYTALVKKQVCSIRGGLFCI